MPNHPTPTPLWPSPTAALHRVLPVFLTLAACGSAVPDAQPEYTEEREACADHNPLRNAFYGDLHVHGAFSFDARNYGTVSTPAEVLAFAQGSPVTLAPLDDQGRGTREVRIDRPLDFVGLTEHGEFLGEINICTTPGAPGYDSERCAPYTGGDDSGAFDYGVALADPDPTRFVELCGADGTGCASFARERWQAMQDAAEQANDRTSTCEFTAFVAYEYTNTSQVSNLHRNVVFRNGEVPDLPITHFEAPTPLQLWQQLDEQCVQADSACDVIVLPHNSNLSNGKLFPTEMVGADEDAQRRAASLRARMEPVVEVFQHKGDSECRNGFPGTGGDIDPLCEWEKLRGPDDETCGDEVGSGGMRLWGCVHRNDFVRNALKTGQQAQRRLGVNPYRLGFIGSTDTHNGTPGHVDGFDFPGHVGVVDDTADKRLGEGNITHDGFLNNPGGLAGVWAVENSRDAIFEAMRRRETFATSGPRIPVRAFAGALSADDWCDDPDRYEKGYTKGVAMGGVLNPGNKAPVFGVEAWADPGPPGKPGVPLERMQMIKVWVDGQGVHERVYDIAGDPDGTADVDVNTCEPLGGGADRLCATWQDPEHNPDAHAAYYVRVLENPTCRWSTRQCNAMPASERPDRCEESHMPKVGQQRAWGSPIYVEPR